MTPEEQRYMKMMEERSSLLPDEGVDMEAEELAAPRPDNSQMQMPSPAQSKTGGMGMAGDTAMAGGMIGANPYVAGAGLALKTVGAVDDAVRNSNQSKIDAYNKKIMAQRSAIRNIFA